MTDQVSRYEFEALVRRVDVNGDRLGGVGVLAVQIQELAKDLAAHEKIHEQDARRRTDSRRWIIAMAVAVVAAIDGPLVTVLLAVRH